MITSVGNGQRLCTVVQKCRKPCIFNISSTSDPIFDNPWEWSFSTCSYLVSISKHSHQIEAIWIAFFLFEHFLESSTKPRVFSVVAKTRDNFKEMDKICGLYIHTTMFWGSHCVPPSWVQIKWGRDTSLNMENMNMFSHFCRGQIK